MKLFVNCRAYAFDPVARAYRTCSAFGVDGSRFAFVGEPPVGIAAERIDLCGATVVPAFADCHVHLAETGYFLGDRDFSSVCTAAAFETRLRAFASHATIFAGRLDDTNWPSGTRAEPALLERLLPGRRVLVARVDVHSCLVNRATLAKLELDEGLEGIERDASGSPTGRLWGAANYRAQERFVQWLPLADRRAASRRAILLALERGAVHLHAQLIGVRTHDACGDEIEALRAVPGAKIYPKICEPDPALAASLDLPFVGGDVFLDGSLGSGTAALGDPYCDRTGNGMLARSDAELERFFFEAERLGISAGVHAIGDRAIEQCLRTWERVLCGKPSARARHFIEHFELASRAQIARAVRLGLLLSVQPQFDAAWGGPDGMYRARLGSERAGAMNAMRSALDAGAILCGGDDSPVCALSPLAGMAAACEHHVATERLRPLEALTMYAYDAARLGHAETHTGLLAAGYDADFVVLDRDPFADGSFASTQVLATWSDGACVAGGAP